MLNLYALERGRFGALGVWAVAGAVLPDVPNGLFFAYHRIVAGMDSAAIYAELYPQAQWQTVLAPWHSVWLVVVIALLARWRRHDGLLVLAASVGLHLVADLLTHGVDAHPHLWPLPWRFTSPVSYWDRAHFAAVFVPLELVAVVASSWAIWRRGDSIWRRLLLVGASGWLVLAYGLGWVFWGT